MSLADFRLVKLGTLADVALQNLPRPVGITGFDSVQYRPVILHNLNIFDGGKASKAQTVKVD